MTTFHNKISKKYFTVFMVGNTNDPTFTLGKLFNSYGKGSLGSIKYHSLSLLIIFEWIIKENGIHIVIKIILDCCNFKFLINIILFISSKLVQQFIKLLISIDRGINRWYLPYHVAITNIRGAG